METPVAEVLISGIDGRLHKHVINPASNRIDVSNFESGWYFLKVADGKEWYKARMVKMRAE